ncbi:hypothetical protein ACFCX4_28750 [Kitasatospora sp. NPDC056327]|uniref:hypothetical protein n=1 Tax=Kitasatospora sp. NPDC056327 TaxID=3345785 RepID=UPI0035E30382
MSHPLTRRIAQAALLVAAGATPLVAAGSASAADALLPKGDLAAPLGQLTNTDAGSTLQHTTHQLGQAAGDTGAATVAAGVPATADATGNIVAQQLPEANEKASSLTAPVDQTAATTGQLAGVTPRLTKTLAGKLGEAVTGHAATPQRSSHAGANPIGGLAPAGAVTNAVPGASGLTQAVPSTGAVTDALPLGSVTRALPGGLASASGLPGADVLGLAEHGSANRLGGTDLGPNSPLNGLSGLTSALGPLGGLLGGVNGGSISGLPIG